MGNTQARSPGGTTSKNPRSGKYTGKYNSNVAGQTAYQGRNGIDAHQFNQNSRPKLSSTTRETPLHIPLKEFDLPDFLQLNYQPPRSRNQSPVMQRNLGDPDPVIVQDGNPSKGLLIPQKELEVPDFLVTKDSSHKHNGTAVRVDVNHGRQKAKLMNGPLEHHRTGNSKARDPGNVRAPSHGPTHGRHSTNKQLNASDPGNVRAISAHGRHISNEQLNASDLGNIKAISSHRRHISSEQLNASDPGNVRAIATHGRHSSNEQLNMSDPGNVRDTSKFGRHSSSEQLNARDPSNVRATSTQGQYSYKEQLSARDPGNVRATSTFGQHSSNEQLNASDPGNVRATSTFGRHTSNEQLNASDPGNVIAISAHGRHSSNEQLNARGPANVRATSTFGRHTSTEQLNISDPANVRTTSTFARHTSNEQLNMESDLHRHGRPAQRTDVSPRGSHSPPATRGKIVSNSTSLAKSKEMSHSSENLQRSRENLQIRKQVDVPEAEEIDDVVDDFQDFRLVRKNKKSASNSRKVHISDDDKFAPGVTGRHVVNKQRTSKYVTNSNENASKETQGQNNVNNWSMNDTDSIPSTSSQSFTETFSPQDVSTTSKMVKNSGVQVHAPHFELDSNEAESESHGSGAGNAVGDTSLGYQDSSLEGSGKRITRQNSLQAQLRTKIQEYERTQKQQSLQRVRYDSDSTTVSEPSAFNESMSSVTRAQGTGFTSYINHLHEDLLLKIFSYLSTPDLCRASGVCRRWQDLCWDPVLWNTIEILNHQDSDINRVLRNILARLSSSTQGYCLTVHGIKLNGSELLSDKGLGFIARFCIDLEDLEIIGCCCITSKGVQDVLYNCHNLYHLNLTGCSCVNSIAAPNANGFNMSNHGSYLQLRHLDMSDCVAFDDLGLRMLGMSCGMLESLYLRRCSRITDVGMKHIANHCHHLKELSTSDCYKVRDFSLKEIAKNIPNLKYLSVAKCPISDTGIKYIGRYCVKLKYLNVRGCEAVTDTGIAFVVQNCLKIRSLDIGKCNVTDNSMHTIGIHCPQLKKLSMKGCDRVSDAGIRSIAAQCCNIQYLNVQECNLDYDTFVYIRQHCRNCIIEHTCPAFF